MRGPGRGDLLRMRAVAALEGLSEERLMAAVEYLEYLREKEEREATRPVLEGASPMAAFEEAESDLREETVPVEEIRRRPKRQMLNR